MNTTHPLVFILMNSTEGLVFVLMNSTEGLVFILMNSTEGLVFKSIHENEYSFAHWAPVGLLSLFSSQINHNSRP